MSDRQERPPSPHPSAPLEPGVRAARKRLGLTQRQAAERMNASIDSFRRWDRGKGQPGDAGRMQMVAIALETPMEVLWPPSSNPQVARALEAEKQRAAERTQAREPRPEVPVEQGAIEPSETAPQYGAAPQGAASLEEAKDEAEEPSDLASQREFAASLSGPAEPRASAPPHVVPRKRQTERQPAGRVTAAVAPAAAPSYDEWDASPEPSAPASERSPNPGVRTLARARPAARLTWRRVVAAVSVAGVLGVSAMVAASAVESRQADAERTAATTTPKVQAKRKAAAARHQSETRMLVAEKRGDFDAAIVVARQLDDQAALLRYHEAAAKVLVRRAEQAARRGDLSLARSRLKRAQDRYETAPGAEVVQARIRQIEQQRTARAKKRRADARRAAAEQQKRAADSSPEPATSSQETVPAPQASKPSSSSSSTSSSSSSSAAAGGGSGKDSESTVDPGIF